MPEYPDEVVARVMRVFGLNRSAAEAWLRESAARTEATAAEHRRPAKETK